MVRREIAVVALIANAIGCAPDPSPMPAAPQISVGSTSAPLVISGSLELLPSSVPPPQSAPCVIATGYSGDRRYLATWVDARSGEPHIYAGRYDLDWKALDGEGIRVSDAPLDSTRPLVTSCDESDGFIVAWWNGDEIRARILRTDLAPWTGPFTVASAVGSSGELVLGMGLVAWTDDTGPVPAVRLASIRPSAVLDSKGILLGEGTKPSRPRPGRSCRECVNAVLEFRGPTGSGVAVDLSLDTGKFKTGIFSLPGAFVARSARTTSYVDDKGNFGAIVGSVGPFLYASSPLEAAPPSDDVSRHTLLAWIGSSGDVRAARATLERRVDDPGFLIRAGGYTHPGVVVASGSSQHFAVVYAEHAAGKPETSRLRATLVTSSGALGDACETDSACESGFCSGVCCDRPCGGACETCGALEPAGGSAGTCRPITGWSSKCPGGDECNEYVCDGVQTDACVRRSVNKHCGTSAHCDGDVVVPGGSCSADGRCEVSASRKDCSPYACIDALCFTRCSADDACAKGSRCVDGKCVEGGCGCAFIGGGDDQLATALGSIALLAFVLRARRGNRPGTRTRRPRA